MFFMRIFGVRCVSMVRLRSLLFVIIIMIILLVMFMFVLSMRIWFKRFVMILIVGGMLFVLFIVSWVLWWILGRCVVGWIWGRGVWGVGFVILFIVKILVWSWRGSWSWVLRSGWRWGWEVGVWLDCLVWSLWGGDIRLVFWGGVKLMLEGCERLWVEVIILLVMKFFMELGC